MALMAKYIHYIILYTIGGVTSVMTWFRPGSGLNMLNTSILHFETFRHQIMERVADLDLVISETMLVRWRPSKTMVVGIPGPMA